MRRPGRIEALAPGLQPHSYQRPVEHTPNTPSATKPVAMPKFYNPRHPEQTLLYRTVAEHFETW